MVRFDDWFLFGWWFRVGLDAFYDRNHSKIFECVYEHDDDDEKLWMRLRIQGSTKWATSCMVNTKWHWGHEVTILLKFQNLKLNFQNLKFKNFHFVDQSMKRLHFVDQVSFVSTLCPLRIIVSLRWPLRVHISLRTWSHEVTVTSSKSFSFIFDLL